MVFLLLVVGKPVQYFYGVLVEQLGVEQLLGSRTHGALLLEEVVRFHDTDFF